VGLHLNETAFPTGPPPAPTGLVSLFGNPDSKPEQVLAYETGYRFVPTPKWSFDLAAYYNVYHDGQSYVPGTPYSVATPIPHIVFPENSENNLTGQTYGLELSAQWKPVDRLRLAASYTWLHMKLQPNDITAGDSPQNQFQIHSYYDLTRNIDFSTGLYYTDRLPDQHVDSYFRLDVGVNWRLGKDWEIGLFGQNLTDGSHPEFGSYRTPRLTEIPRRVFAKITWRF
jgi:iron complex outermembrane recepter protein